MNELTCPYCNSVVPLAGSVKAGQTLSCPRCEERFKALADVHVAPSALSLSPSPSAPSRRLSNRALALVVVSVMLLLAAGTTTFALLTEHQRRENDRGLKQSRSWKRPPPLDLEEPERVSPRATFESPFGAWKPLDLEEPERVSPLAPLELDALQLLPGDLDVLAGVHVALVMREEHGKRLLRRDVPGLRGSVESRLLSRLRELTGLGAEDFDHVVVGARIKELPPAIVLAVRTRSGYEPAKLVKRLHAKAHPQARGQKVYHFRQELLPTHAAGLLNCVDDRTLLLAWEGQLSDVMPSKRQDQQTPRPELASLLKVRVKPSGPVWIAGQLDAKHVQGLSLLLGLAGIPDAERKALLGVRSFAFWLTLEKGVAVRAVTRSADEKARAAVETYLRGNLGDKADVTLFAEQEWLTLQYRPRE